jgi:Xaa-Pro aminopeptidase
MGTSARMAKLRERLLSENADAIAITSVHNVAYCTGFRDALDDEPAHVALVGAADAVLLTDGRYIEALTAAARGSEWRVCLAGGSLAEAVSEELRALGATRLALETSLSHARFEVFSAVHSGDVIEAAGWVEELRTAKDAEEISAIEAAQTLTDSAFRHLVEDGVVCAGVRERDIALELEFFMRREGSEGVAFPPIVASGPNSALPHAAPSERTLAQGDFVVLDFGARVGGYCSDMTRTVVVGRATDRHQEIYDAALEANRVGIAAVAAGRPGREIDAEARAVITQRGFGDCFGHGLGHGVGLEVHERPGLGPRSEAPVPLGAVLTIEPGIYVPGYGGVRIEDLTVVDEAGARVLTRSTKELLEL